MRYEKPVVLNISTRAQMAAGEDAMGCVTGPVANGWYESCGNGTSANWGCVSGPGPSSFARSCISGSTASPNGDCLSGSSVAYYCAAGTGGGTDPYGCNAGPSFA
jgi:hypothetical protein